MREIPGYYFDEARNRYFKIERGGIRANDANLGDGDASSDGRRAYYDVDTLRKIKRQKEDEAAQKTLEAIRVRSIKLHLKDCQLPQRIEQRFSPLSFLLASRSHGIPNRTGRMFTHSFIKPYMPRLLKKTERFQFTANATTAADCGFGLLLLGDKRGQVKIYDSTRLRDPLRPNQLNSVNGFPELYAFNQPGAEFSASKVLSEDSLCLVTRGGAGQPGELLYLKSSSFAEPDTIALNVFPSMGTSLYCLTSSESYIIAGGEASFSVLPLSQAYPSLYRCHSPSAVLAVSFLPQQPQTVYSGCRNGSIFGNDLRMGELHAQKIKFKASQAIYKLMSHTPNYLISAELGGKIAQWDIRHPSRPVQLFTGFRNTCDLGLGVAMHELSSTLIAAAEDRWIHHWSLISAHEVTNPVGPFPAPVSHIIPWSQNGLHNFTTRNGELAFSNPQDGYWVGYENQLELWAW